jgi:hypothetical protein
MTVLCFGELVYHFSMTLRRHCVLALVRGSGTPAETPRTDMAIAPCMVSNAEGKAMDYQLQCSISAIQSKIASLDDRLLRASTARTRPIDLLWKGRIQIEIS